MFAARLVAIVGFAVACGGFVALAMPLLLTVSEAQEGRWFLGGLVAAGAGTAILAADVALLVARLRPEPARRRRVRDLCLQLGIFGLLEAALLLTRREG
jgi:ABC-type cobalamin transport system permease subunit